jgi:disulfide bond formation protein DsbB
MPTDPSKLNSGDPEGLCTRSSGYAPAAPEQMSKAARVIVRMEVTLMLLVVAGLGLRFYRAHRDDHAPVKIARSAVALPLISALPAGLASAESASLDGADAAKGQVLYMQTCTACHGQNLQGMPHQGVNLRESKFVASTNDPKLVAFIKVGRKPADAKNTTGLLMPPRGGNPSLDDDSLGHIVAFLRQAQKDASPAQETQATQPPSTRPVATVEPQSAGASAN